MHFSISFWPQLLAASRDPLASCPPQHCGKVQDKGGHEACVCGGGMLYPIAEQTAVQPITDRIVRGGGGAKHRYGGWGQLAVA